MISEDIGSPNCAVPHDAAELSMMSGCDRALCVLGPLQMQRIDSLLSDCLALHVQVPGQDAENLHKFAQLLLETGDGTCPNKPSLGRHSIPVLPEHGGTCLKC